MKSKKLLRLTLFCLFIFCAHTVFAEHHRATHLGNPATRFAPTMYSPADLRARFSDPELRPDFAEVLRQWGWPGNPDDFFSAGLTNEIVEWEIPVGNTMPFMSSREDGKPICLRNVTWAGKEPIHAYAFVFHSNGRIYRCIIPKPCSNFFVVDLGEEPESGLAIACDVQEKIVIGHKIEICLTVHNTGNIPATNITVTLPVPADATAVATTDGGALNNGAVVWNLTGLPVNATKEVCMVLKTHATGTLNFNPVAASAEVTATQSTCETEVYGIPAILLEKSDDPDPVPVGTNTTYTVRVTNQGTADDTDVAISVVVDSELVPVSSDNPNATIDGQTVTFPVVAILPAKQAVEYHIIAKGVTPGNAHTRFIMSSSNVTSPITAEESTTVY